MNFAPVSVPVAALEISGLRKSFDRPAVNGFDLAVRAGEFYALLGPNGAGKTTILRMVAGLLRPDAGAIRIFGVDALADPVAAKQVVAWVSDEPMIYDKLTPFEYLEFVAGLWGVDAATAETRASDLVDWLGLAGHAHERCEGFSKGMRQKVALAGALVHDPKLIVLDEPLTGLDAAGWRRKVDVVGRALVQNRPDRGDPLDVLAKVGGFEIAGLVGVVLVGAARRVPVALDGFISGAAALVAAALAPHAGRALFASHRSVEPGHAIALQHLGLAPYVDLGLRLGEGTGGVLFLHLARAAARIYTEMATFKSAGVDGPA